MRQSFSRDAVPRCPGRSSPAAKRWANRFLQSAVELVLAGLDVQFNAQSPQLPAAEVGQAQLDQVLLGRDHNAIRCLRSRPGAQVVHVGPRVGVMVGKSTEGDDVRPQVAEGAAKRLGVADAAEGGHRPAAQPVEGGGPVAVAQVRPAGASSRPPGRPGPDARPLPAAGRAPHCSPDRSASAPRRRPAAGSTAAPAAGRAAAGSRGPTGSSRRSAPRRGRGPAADAGSRRRGREPRSPIPPPPSPPGPRGRGLAGAARRGGSLPAPSPRRCGRRRLP